MAESPAEGPDTRRVVAPFLVTANVAGTSTGKDSVAFVINVSLQQGADCYTAYPLKRRFRQFEALHRALKETAGKGVVVPELPRGELLRFSPNKNADFLLKRRDSLNDYLASLVAEPALLANDELRGFLELSSAETLFTKLAEKELLLSTVASSRALNSSRRGSAAPTNATNIASASWLAAANAHAMLARSRAMNSS